MTLVFPFSISSREASIGEQARAGDVAGFGTRQVGDKAGDLIGITVSLERCDGNQRLREVAVGWIHVSINRAGLDVVNGDAARAEVSGKSLRESRDRSLRKRIDRTADEWHALAVGTANVDDTPAFAQMPRGFLCRNEQTAHIDGDQLLEIFKRELLNGREDTGARVVHQNINGPECPDGVATASRTASVSAASALIASAFPPAASIERTTSLALPGDALYVRATAAPSVASRLAIAAPMLREPPVTSATMPASFLVMFVFIIFSFCSATVHCLFGRVVHLLNNYLLV